MPKILVKDVKIYYETLGEGEPICLIMGWGGSSVMWYRQREMLAKSYKVILIDNRGTGRSAKPKYPYTMEMFVDDIKGVLDLLRNTYRGNVIELEDPIEDTIVVVHDWLKLNEEHLGR